MSKAGFILLFMAIIVPAIMSRTTRYDKWHFPIACAMYVLSIFGIAMIWAEQ